MAIADYPEAESFIQARYYTVLDRVISKIVIHTTDGANDYDKTAAYFASMDDGREASAHFVIGRGGGVIQCVREADKAWHAHDGNLDSIGIEHSVRTVINPSETPTIEQYESSARLVVYLCQKYGIAPTRNNILAHKEADSKTSKDCPSNWDWEYYMGIVNSMLSPSAFDGAFGSANVQANEKDGLSTAESAGLGMGVIVLAVLLFYLGTRA